MAAQDVVAGFADDGDGRGGDLDQYGCAGVGASDAEVVQAAAVAQGEFAELVDGVVADPEVAVWGVCRAGFGAARGQSVGRPRALDTSKAALAQRMHASANTIAAALGVSRATVYRVLAEDLNGTL